MNPIPTGIRYDHEPDLVSEPIYLLGILMGRQMVWRKRLREYHEGEHGYENARYVVMWITTP